MSNIPGSNQPETGRRTQKLKEIDDLYNSQIKQIYNQSKQAVRQRQKETKDPRDNKFYSPSSSSNHNLRQSGLNRILSDENLLKSDTIKAKDKTPKPAKVQNIPQPQKKTDYLALSEKKEEDDKVRASTFLQGQSARTIQVLRKQIETKQLKSRELAHKCENLIEKLRKHLTPEQLETELASIQEFSQRKIQQLQNLFKIRNEEIFFKLKLGIIKLLQEFQVSKEEINGINQVNNQSALFSFMMRKLKLKLKDFKAKQSSSSYEIQKDKIINQKYEERIHYLIETNQLLKLTEEKLKDKIEDLRSQLNKYIDKIKDKQIDIQDRESQIFRLKKQSEQLHSNNQKLTHAQRSGIINRTDQKRLSEAKEKEMKSLLSSYYLERKKLQNQLETKQGEIQQILIREKFLLSENQRLNREYVRWKQRYEWVEKEKQNRQRENEEEKNQLIQEFENYKSDNNQGVYMECKVQTDQAYRKIQQYKTQVQNLMAKLEQERSIAAKKEEQIQDLYQESQKKWLQKIKQLEKHKQQEINDLNEHHDYREKSLEQQYMRKSTLLESEMQARIKALLAQNDKKATRKYLTLTNENEEIKRELQILREHFEAKQAYQTTYQRNKNHKNNSKEKSSRFNE